MREVFDDCFICFAAVVLGITSGALHFKEERIKSVLPLCAHNVHTYKHENL